MKLVRVRCTFALFKSSFYSTVLCVTLNEFLMFNSINPEFEKVLLGFRCAAAALGLSTGINTENKDGIKCRHAQEKIFNFRGS